MLSTDFVYEKLEEKHLPHFYDIRFSVEENIVHPHQINYLLRKQALEDIAQGGGWICRAGEEYVGLCFGIFTPEPLIGGLFVKPEYQGKGIGKKLLSLVTRWMFSNGATEISLTTDPHSKAAKFYSHMGWAEIGMDDFGIQSLFKIYKECV